MTPDTCIACFGCQLYYTVSQSRYTKRDALTLSEGSRQRRRWSRAFLYASGCLPMATPIGGDQAEAEGRICRCSCGWGCCGYCCCCCRCRCYCSCVTFGLQRLRLLTHTQQHTQMLYRHTSHLISDRADAGGAICCASILLPYQSAQILLMPKKSTYSVHACHGAAADVLQSEFDIEFESVKFASRRRSPILKWYSDI